MGEWKQFVWEIEVFDLAFVGCLTSIDLCQLHLTVQIYLQIKGGLLVGFLTHLEREEKTEN